MTWDAEDWVESDGGDERALVRIERAILGTIIQTPVYLDYAALLEGRDFYSELRGKVFETARAFPKRNFDGILLAYKMGQTEPNCPVEGGWLVAMAELLDHYVVAENFIQYVEIVREEGALRRTGLSKLPRRKR